MYMYTYICTCIHIYRCIYTNAPFYKTCARTLSFSELVSGGEGEAVGGDEMLADLRESMKAAAAVLVISLCISVCVSVSVCLSLSVSLSLSLSLSVW